MGHHKNYYFLDDFKNGELSETTRSLFSCLQTARLSLEKSFALLALKHSPKLEIVKECSRVYNIGKYSYCICLARSE